MLSALGVRALHDRALHDDLQADARIPLRPGEHDRVVFWIKKRRLETGLRRVLWLGVLVYASGSGSGRAQTGAQNNE